MDPREKLLPQWEQDRLNELRQEIFRLRKVSRYHESSGRGGIHDMDKYLSAKIIDHKRWAGILPRNITPSDVDVIFDNDWRVMFVEMCSYSANWNDIPNGQHELYRNLVDRWNVSVIARHETPDWRPIDSYGDVVEFTVIRYDPNADLRTIKNLSYDHHVGNDVWVAFVKRWFGV